MLCITFTLPSLRKAGSNPLPKCQSTMEEKILVIVESSKDSMEIRLKCRVKRLVMEFLPPPGGPMAHTRFCEVSWEGRGKQVQLHCTVHTHTCTTIHIPHQQVPGESCPSYHTSACGPPIVAAVQWVAVPHTSLSEACSDHLQTPHTCSENTLIQVVLI